MNKYEKAVVEAAVEWVKSKGANQLKLIWEVNAYLTSQKPAEIEEIDPVCSCEPATIASKVNQLVYTINQVIAAVNELNGGGK